MYALRVRTRAVVLTESLAETGTDRVKRFRKDVERRGGLYGSMPDARTVEVHFDAALVCVL